MAPPPFDLTLQLRQHGTAVRRLAMELLRDDAAADDAAQETWVRAVQRPPRHEDAVGGWLATILHNVARKLRRSERRRLRREAVAAQLRVNEVEDHSTALAREELVHRLVAAVTSLDAPFREAIWQRYFEGLAPREIATARGVPLAATVKSRLQRGLGLLREKLGEREGTDWRAGLLVAFGWQEGVVGSGTAAATMWPGVLLMTAWMKSAAAVLVVLGAGFLWWSLREQAAPVSVVVDAGKEASAVSAGVGAKAQEGALGAVLPVVERTAVEPAVAANPRNATVRGRCVDEHGVPLAGCKVVFSGRAADTELVEAWIRAHGREPTWEKPEPQVTRTDGRFTFEFEPPPFRFALNILREDLVPKGGEWASIVEGQYFDVGDVVCLPGVRLGGIVMDDTGKPVANASVGFPTSPLTKERVGKRDHIRSRDHLAVRSGEDGRFSLIHRVLPGRHEVRVEDRLLESPDHVDLDLMRPNEQVTIVVRSEKEEPTIVGRVVDDAGQPVANAHVQAGLAVCKTQADGEFRLQRRAIARSASEVLTVRAHGLEPTESSKSLPWGSTGVELRLIRGRPFDVRVVDAKHEPVTDFTVRMIPRDFVGLSSSGYDARVRARGPLIDGVARIQGITRGKWLVVVEFPPGQGLERIFAPLEVTSLAGQSVTLIAERPARRLLRVVRADGTPVGGTRVQLCDLFGGAFKTGGQVFAEREWLSSVQNTSAALILLEGSTDADGCLELAGPAQHDLGLRILGPGHLQVEQEGVRLDKEEELVVTVMSGARLVGRITSKEAVDELKRLASGGGPADSSRSFTKERNPRLFLQAIQGVGGHASSAIRDDGSFDVDWLPPGTWQLKLRYYEMRPRGRGLGLAWTTTQCSIAEVVLRDGVTTRVDTELKSILPGTLEGQVVKNGAPLPNAIITLQPEYPPSDSGAGDADWINLETDAEGRFTHRGRSGSYRLLVQDDRDDRLVTFLHATNPAAVVAGQTTHHTYSVAAGRLNLTVLDPRGQPAQVVTVAMVGED
jgi:RNA polymerase sigma-70 factor (ECF subfamily)